MQYQLSDLIDLKECQRLLDSFCAVVGVAAAIIDLEGNVLVGSKWQRICTGFHRLHPVTSKRCIQSDTLVAGEMLEGKKFSLYRCMNGLTDAASPIIIEGQHMANAFIGQFLLEKPDADFFRRQAAKHGFDEKNYLSAVAELPIVSEENLQPIILFLTTLAETIATLGLKQLRQLETEKELRKIQDELESRIRSRTAELETSNWELRLSEEYFRRTFDQGPIGAAILTLDGTIQRVNPALCLTLGYACEELTEHNLEEFLHPDDLNQDINAFESLKGGKTDHVNMEKRFLRKNGDVVWMNLTIQLMRNARGEPVYLFPMVENISERKYSEEIKARLAAIVESSEDGIIGRNLDGIITSWNSGAEKIFGYTAEEMIGQSLSRTLPFDNREEVQELLKAVKSGNCIKNFETVRLRKDGKRIHVSLTVSPILDTAGNLIGVASINRDISEKKLIEAELESYTKRLEQSNNSLQEFASVASHDLQEPLRKIRAFGDRLRTRYANVLDERGRDYLDRMNSAAGRMSELIQTLLEYSRVSTRVEPFQSLDLNMVIRDVLTDLEIRIEEEKGEVKISELPILEADPHQIRQLFMNLIGNALKFHGEESPKVRIEAIPMDGGGKYQIRVKDNGIGFDEKYLDRIFAPFQRLHERNSKYPGTGMGLAICRKIVERHGGVKTARSEKGKGSVFTVTLPARQDFSGVRKTST